MPIRGHHSAPSHTVSKRDTLHTGESHRATIVDGYGVRRERPSNTFHPRSKSIIVIRKMVSTIPKGSILLYTSVIYESCYLNYQWLPLSLMNLMNLFLYLHLQCYIYECDLKIWRWGFHLESFPQATALL